MEAVSEVPDSLTDTEKAQLYVAGEPFQQRFLAENLAGLVQGSGQAALSALSSQLEGLASALDEDGQFGDGPGSADPAQQGVASCAGPGGFRSNSFGAVALPVQQDVEFEVRSAMCQGLPHFVRALTGKAAAIDKVADELLVLLEDEEQATGPEAAGYALSRPARRAVLATFLQHCRLPDPHVELHRSLAAVFGTLVARLVADMDGDAEVNTCLSGFRNLAWRHDAPTRLSCAAGFLAVLKAANPRRYASHLHDTLVRLAADPDASVRQEVANTFHEVVDLLGKERCVQYLRPTLLALLADENRGVVSALAGNLGKVLEQYHLPFNQALNNKMLDEMLEPLLKLEQDSGHNWRLQLGFLRAVAELPKFYPPDIVYDKFLPVVLRYMAGGAAALVSAAAESAAAIWQLPYAKPEHRTALYGRLILEFAQGKSWRQRAVFLDFCEHALRRFSSSFYKASQVFKEQVVQTPGDAIAAAATGQYRQDVEKRQLEKAYVWDQEALSR
ncbi:hypothetical protein N2152v2_010565 [Parachlorella kessleri]